MTGYEVRISLALSMESCEGIGLAAIAGEAMVPKTKNVKVPTCTMMKSVLVCSKSEPE